MIGRCLNVDDASVQLLAAKKTVSCGCQQTPAFLKEIVILINLPEIPVRWDALLFQLSVRNSKSFHVRGGLFSKYVKIAALADNDVISKSVDDVLAITMLF